MATRQRARESGGLSGAFSPAALSLARASSALKMLPPRPLAQVMASHTTDDDLGLRYSTSSCLFLRTLMLHLLVLEKAMVMLLLFFRNFSIGIFFVETFEIDSDVGKCQFWFLCVVNRGGIILFYVWIRL